MKANPSDMVVQINTRGAPPCPELQAWLNHLAPEPAAIEAKAFFQNNLAAAFECGLRSALARAAALGKTWCLFCDQDQRPSPATSDVLLDAPYALTCLRHTTSQGDKSWKYPWSFHTGIWLARAADLQKLPRPAFAFPIDSEGKATGCVCLYVRKLAALHGLSTGHVGFCEHTPAPEKPYLRDGRPVAEPD